MALSENTMRMFARMTKKCRIFTPQETKFKNDTVMLSNKLHDVLKAQINEEMWLAYFYL